jgi:hypothetical protein
MGVAASARRPDIRAAEPAVIVQHAEPRRVTLELGTQFAFVTGRIRHGQQRGLMAPLT